MGKYLKDRPTVGVGAKFIQSANRYTGSPIQKYRYIFSPILDAYKLNKSTKREKLILTPEEYVKGYNEGRYRDSEKVSFWEDDVQDRYIIITKSMTVDEKASRQKPIPTGIYQTVLTEKYGVMLKKQKLTTDKYFSLTALDTKLVKDVNFFLDNKHRYDRLNFVHKRGILLFGPPGNGKTMVIEHIAKKYKNKARIVFVSVSHIREFFDLQYYEALKDKPVILVLEEITTAKDDYGSMPKLLNFLDGEDSWAGTLTISTTNYPEKLPKNLIDRPARFDVIHKVDVPSAKTREAYLRKLLNKTEIHPALIKHTDGYSLAYLKELIVAAKIYGRPILDVIKEFKIRKDLIKHDFEERGTIGYNSDENEDGINDMDAEIDFDKKRTKIGFDAD